MHQRLLGSFLQAASAGDASALVGLLAEDAVLVTDGGPEGRRGRGFRNLQHPLAGAAKIAAFVVATSRDAGLEAEMHELNGQPAIVLYENDQPSAALLLGVANGRIHRVFFHADTARLRHLGPRRPKSQPN
jgi:RNA polymerase sigma-70 factor (ECF subfamily)